MGYLGRDSKNKFACVTHDVTWRSRCDCGAVRRSVAQYNEIKRDSELHEHEVTILFRKSLNANISGSRGPFEMI
jgi:GTP cyclohydrolase II